MTKTKATITNRLDPFDFDYWKQLAKKDPVKFEHDRQDAINDIIETCPVYLRKRLRGLQWRIDLEIRRSKNAMDSCLRLNRMMMDSVCACDGLIHSVRSLTGPDHKSYSVTEAVVIPFRRRP
ncbi:MAG: DUF3135 domain-containing protein [Methylococcaceae bacterium]|nr:DUF3135 domain-containing protein [Methylococcaceae bacterium]MCI0668214.1 DUF3135 domain-containing protein [Methylococcaceae bacterium]MCI0733252.1 DUF3135 domain-containing protein [Methylococcaceae bacterium]